MSAADQTRLDRLALPRTLLEVGDLTLTRAKRPPQKAKRLRRATLARRAEKHVETVLSTPVYAAGSFLVTPLPDEQTLQPEPALAAED